MSSIEKVFVIGSLAVVVGLMMFVGFLLLRLSEKAIRLFLFNLNKKKIIDKVEQLGYMWVVCTINGVTAVCTYSAFNEAYGKWRQKILNNPKAEWGGRTICVEPTFTFSKDSMPMVTGRYDDLEDLAVDLICDLLKLKGKYNKSFIHQQCKDLVGIIVKRDDRLFVPFAGDKWRPEWERYQHTSLSQARRQLYKDVLDALPKQS